MSGNRGKGRPKGAKNKMTVAAKEAFSLAFHGIGGVPALQDWATEHPTEFYKLYSRLIPIDVTSGGQPIKPSRVNIALVSPDDERQGQ